MAAKAMPRETMLALRETIARIEGKSSHAARMEAGKQEAAHPVEGEERAGRLLKSDPRIHLEDILAEVGQSGAMTEIRTGSFGEAGAAAGLAFALAQSCKARDTIPSRYLMIGNPWAAREAGLPYAPGLGDFGFAPQRIIYASPRRIEDALWLADAALGCGAFVAIMLEIHGNSPRFGLTESRRLALKTRAAGGSLILIRHSGEEEASSASLRLKVEPAPAAAQILADGTVLGGSIGNPVFRVIVEKSRFSAFSEFILEWNTHDRRLYPFSSAHAAKPSSWYKADTGASFPAAGDRPAGTQALGSVLAFERAS